MPEMADVNEWRGRTMVGSDGEKIGKIGDIYEDPDTGKPEWATVNTGLFGMKSNFVPLAGASVAGEDVRAPVTKDQVKDAPGVDVDGDLSEAEERRLFEHYNVPYTTEGSTTAQGGPVGGSGGALGGGEGVGRDVSGPQTDDAMTRSEEELRVGTAQREVGRARLRKYVVTEMVTKTVPVRREEVRIEREPITDANRDAAMSGGDITEEEHEVVLHAEEPVVEKRVVAQERVSLGTETVTEEREVSEQVRKERIETEGLDDTSAR